MATEGVGPTLVGHSTFALFVHDVTALIILSDIGLWLVVSICKGIAYLCLAV